ncbi:MAG TPA: hypothetical protein VNE39_28610 [Planctomycetota bacterium]|nr:hypothetical protein [Planctomycetota bacterium]
MGVMTEQMEALTNGLLTAARGRAAAIAGVREDTVRLLGQARTRRQEVGAKRRAAGEDLTRELREAAGTLTAKVGALLGEFDAAQGQRASDLNAFLARHKEARAGELYTLFEDLGRAREEMAREFAVEIQGLVKHIQSGMAEFLGDARADRAESAEALHDRTAQALAAVHGRVATLVNETMGYLGRCERAHQTMSERLHGMLSGNHQATHEQVTALLSGFRQARQRIAEDLRAAAQLWDRLAQARFGAGWEGEAPAEPPGVPEALGSAGASPSRRADGPAAKPKRKARRKSAAH